MDKLVKQYMDEEIQKLLQRNRTDIVKRVHKRIKQLQKEQQREQKKLS